ncbi:UDP-N-acetylglucosamine--N-acetylmuramyl-(pentapeptide) pyrophosphoryl-undecaprenol N-acetylglucosamine transferase [Nocardia nova SH22a]|uniref:UDP-N-acetylglucosamine--N-acetylmuramyl-(pentapeptide) pyrophosphoryl-undecaprenol N-acetylglucosamine transferase n=1 Tax=Nocardia nova SH22a TaxID=1415166 RepID=W5TDB2_9NOCA|nr:undecaprenyldiphospho-muramoylpentapeptide beta-N-acetylglucosaminyltransferase [Nocardia nova]AHH17164.1 UDP-N-acetylglucosamine--N-acetylmuramyl-(pentapeptide) pyrophosphoryl-undecaprenol N-acetylglucosamine transferase [Nocardia nova SH22a]
MTTGESGTTVSGQRTLSVIVAGGGTAGHIEPAMAVADALRRLDPSIRITALGTSRGLETTLIPERGYPLELIPPVPLPRKPTADLLRLPGRIRAAVARTRAVIDEVQADVIIGFGGYVCVPAYLAAGRGVLGRSRKVPLVVHEANVKAGIANKLGARRAARVLAAVPNSGVHARGRGDAEVVGIPVRESIATLDRAGLRDRAREYFGLPARGPMLLVFGGSQGARRLNEAVSGAAAQLLAAGVSVLHAHGPKNTLDLGGIDPDAGRDGAKYVAVPYLSRMDLAYAAADAAVCRSGAMTVAEVSAVGLPAFYVPLPHGNGEQEFNARPIVAQGGGRIVADAEMTPKYVIDEVIALLTDPAALTNMSVAAAGAGHRDAADEVARIVVEVAGR